MLLTCSVASLKWKGYEIKLFGNFMVTGLLIVAIFAVLDEINVVDIPIINTNLMFEVLYSDPLSQFGHRSIMSLYFGVMLPFLFVLEDVDDRFWFKSAVFLVGVVNTFYLISSGNRSGIAAIMISISLYYIFNHKNKKRILNQYIPNFLISIIIAVFLVFAYKPDNFKRFVFLWANSPFIGHITFNKTPIRDITFDGKVLSSEHAENLYKSDMLRVTILSDTLNGIMKYPFGRGFMKNTHTHFIVDIVYSTGVIGIIWLTLFIKYFMEFILKFYRNAYDKKLFWLFVTPLISWFFVGIMYNSLYLGLAWIYFGIMLSLSDRKHQQIVVDVESPSSTRAP